jgi:diguanylate cyclase (GGDEF)-like protein
MIKPSRPDNEEQRLQALSRYQVLDTPAERSFDDLVTIATALCGTRMGAVTLVDRDRQWFKARQALDVPQTPRDISFCGHAILQPDQVMVVEDAREDPRFFDNPVVVDDPHIRFYAGAPLLSFEGLPLGTLCVFDAAPGRLSPERMQALTALSRQVSLVMELRRYAHEIQQHMSERAWYEQRLSEYNALLERQNADLAEQSRTDALTGLPNRRAMGAFLDTSLHDADGAPRAVSVALLDIDHFKNVNDLYGHASGDHVLAELGRLLRATFAGSGMAARHGGEEFVVVMPDTPLGVAEMQCEFLRMAVADLPLGIPLTVSIGVAAHRQGDTVEQTLARADAALYRAKREGRNRVVPAE